ncbi:NUDIX domain-containing protein [Streptomyces sp. NBC_00820]|uniref:NUDIX domain-containing protein n=1 Tax=Streptomyces sp. NBC_00820 TaxID=2975842 RepID=UPI002ECFAFD1|nr:NUDIX domain-containing protein [Streptomyces sp. NBC_00820]
MTLLVAAVIVHDRAADRVVVLRRGRNAKFAQGMWDLPVGKNEPGEPITETAVRELYEETGLTVRPEALEVVHIIHGAWGLSSGSGRLRSAAPSGRPERGLVRAAARRRRESTRRDGGPSLLERSRELGGE